MDIRYINRYKYGVFAAFVDIVYSLVFSSSIWTCEEERSVVIKLRCGTVNKQYQTTKTLTKECSFSWMGQEFLPEKNQNNMTGCLRQHAMTLLSLVVYVSGLFRCWLTCKRKYYCSGCACKHLILNIFLVKIWTLMPVCCECKHAQCYALLTNSLHAFGYLLPRLCFSIPSHPEHTVGKAL